jgi:hypothetical protein
MKGIALSSGASMYDAKESPSHPCFRQSSPARGVAVTVRSIASSPASAYASRVRRGQLAVRSWRSSTLEPESRWSAMGARRGSKMSRP